MIALLQYNLISRCLFLNRTWNVYRHVRLSWQNQCRGEMSLVVKCGRNCTPAYVVSYDLVEFLSYLSAIDILRSSSRSERQHKHSARGAGVSKAREASDSIKHSAREAGDSIKPGVERGFASATPG